MEYIIVTAVIGIVYWYVKYLVSKHDREDQCLQSWNNQRARVSKQRERRGL